MPKLPRWFVALGLCLAAACVTGGEQEVDPEKQLELYRELSLRFYDLDDLARAEDQAMKGLEIEPDDVQLRLLLGWICQRRGSARDVFAAEKIFRELEDSDDYRAVLGLGVALERKGVLYDEAARGLDSGERVTDAADPRARAEELRELAAGAWAESVECFQRVLAEREGEGQAVNGLARVLALQKRYEESLQWNRKLVAQCESELSVWATQLERPDLTADEETRLRDLRAKSERLLLAVWQQAATLHRALAQREEELAALDQALRYAPEMPELYSLRGQALAQLGRHSEAIVSLETFLKLSTLDFEHPDVQRAYELIATCKRDAAAAKQ